MSKDSPQNAAQPAPARVGKYLMLDVLGEGAFGKVRIAVDETDGQQYAIKIMEKSHIRANELTVQVRREIAVMKAMRHPNIVNLHEVLTSSKNLYMVMDLVIGGELFDAVAKEGRLAEARARLYFQQLVDGIHYCHTRRVYHRDLKPENLLLSGDKQTIKITDFGLSSIKAPDCSTELLHTIMGSPHYIAPEIITSAAAGYDGAKVDVWASGIILFGMLAGYLPFDEPVTRDLYHAIVQAPITFPPHFSYDAIKLLRSMLQKDPKKRPTMEDVKNFAWFRVNYRPACIDEDDPGHTSPTSRSKKTRHKNKKSGERNSSDRRSIDRRSIDRRSIDRRSTDRRSIDRRSIERPRSSQKRDAAPSTVQNNHSSSSTSTSSQPRSSPLSAVSAPLLSVPQHARQPPRLPNSDYGHHSNNSAVSLPNAVFSNATASTRESSTADAHSHRISSDDSNDTSSILCGDAYNDSSSSQAAHSTVSGDLSSKDMTISYPDSMPPPINGEPCIDSGYLFTYVDTPMATSRAHYPKNGFSCRDNSTTAISSGPRSNCITFSSVPPLSPMPASSPHHDHHDSAGPPTTAMAALSIKPTNDQTQFPKVANIDHTAMFISPVSAASDGEFTSTDNMSYPPSRAESAHGGGHIQDGVVRLSVDDSDDEEEVVRQTISMGGRTETKSSVGSEERKPMGIFKPVKSLFKPLAQSLKLEKSTKGSSDSASEDKGNGPHLDDAWCIDSGDAFADVESEGTSLHSLEQQHSSMGARVETGSLKFLADLRRRQSVSNDVFPTTDSKSSEKSGVGSKDRNNGNRSGIFSALNTKLALKLSPSQ